MAISQTSFLEGNEAAIKHGARSYLRRMAEGAPLTANMAEQERSVLLEVATDGARGRVKKQAERFGVASELVWLKMQSAPDAEEAATWLRLWGWLAGCEIRGWRDFAALPAEDGAPAAGEVLASYKQVNDEQTSE